jgi:hypothetical protein
MNCQNTREGTWVRWSIIVEDVLPAVSLFQDMLLGGSEVVHLSAEVPSSVMVMLSAGWGVWSGMSLMMEGYGEGGTVDENLDAEVVVVDRILIKVWRQRKGRRK